MAKLRVHHLSISRNGYGGGPAQSTDDPLGNGGTQEMPLAYGPVLLGRR